MDIFKNFPKVNIMVIGDVMLDRYCWGSVKRISPEAPVPVVTLNRTTLAAGGAANVAANVAGLGATAFLVGIVGTDAEAEMLSQVMIEGNVAAEYLIPFKNRETTVKTRIIAHQQQIVRLDQENALPLTKNETEIILRKIENVWKDIQVLIISDYAKGFLTEVFTSRLITLAKANNKIVLIDPKGQHYAKYKGATVLTPNQSEAAAACKFDENENNLVEKAGNKLLADLAVQAILITEGENGMTLFEKGRKPLKIRAAARKVYDVTGAGDTVIACMAVALGAGASFTEASRISNTAAGIVVENIGTTAVKLEMLKNALVSS